YRFWVGRAPYDFSLDLFVYVMAKRAGLSVVRFPVNFAPREFGYSHWNANFRSKYKFIKRTVQFSLDLRRNLARSAYPLEASLCKSFCTGAIPSTTSKALRTNLVLRSMFEATARISSCIMTPL